MKQTQNNLNILKYIKNSYNDEAFFLSREFRNKMQHLANFATGRYKKTSNYSKINIELIWNEKSYLAKTNNNTIYINCNNYLVSHLSKEDRCLAIIGFLGHEIGHCIFTDFNALNDFLNDNFDYSRLSEKAFEYYKKHKTSFFKYISEIQNILEDPYVENRMCQNYSGSIKNGIEFAIKLLQKSIVKNMFSDDANIYTYLLAQARNCLDEDIYNKYDCFKQTQFCFDELYEYPYPNSKRRFELVLDIFSMIFDEFIAPYENNDIENDIEKPNEKLSPSKSVNKNCKPMDTNAFNYNKKIDDKNAFDIHSIINSVCKSLVNNSAAVSSFNKDDIHLNIGNSIDSSVNIIDAGNQAFYNKLVNQNKSIIKKSELLVKDVILQRQRTSQQKRQEIGNRLDINAYIKRNNEKTKNIFINSKKANKKPQMAVSVIIDESGSMNSLFAVTERAAIIVKEFCNNLNIPVSIIGHNFYNNKVHIDVFETFDSDKNNYSLTKLRAEGSNRDGYALKYVLSSLKRRKEPYKVVFIISDGAPSAYNSFDEALIDINNVLNLYKANNIDLVAFAINDDYESLTQIYGENNIVDSRNIETFPKEMSKILAKKSKKAYLKGNY